MEKELFEFQKKALLGEVSGEPLCAEYRNMWRSCGEDKDRLMRLAMMQQSLPYLVHACHTGMGLTKEYVMENFGEYINGRKTYYDIEGVSGYSYQMYAGFDGNIELSADVTAFMWCDAEVSIPLSKCPRIYVSNGSHVRLSLDGFSAPMVYLFDESTLTIDDADIDSTVHVFKYSDGARVETGKFCLADVRVFPKELKL